MPTSFIGFAQIVYIFVMYNLVSTVCYTLTYVAFMTLNGLMTIDQKSRGLNGGINMVGNVMESLAGLKTLTLRGLMSSMQATQEEMEQLDQALSLIPNTQH